MLSCVFHDDSQVADMKVFQNACLARVYQLDAKTLLACNRRESGPCIVFRLVNCHSEVYNLHTGPVPISRVYCHSFLVRIRNCYEGQLLIKTWHDFISIASFWFSLDHKSLSFIGSTSNSITTTADANAEVK